jgi:hypothetical protein
VTATKTATIFFVVVSSMSAQQLFAQCRVPKTSNEAKLLAFYSAPIAFSPASAPEYAAPWTIRIGAEGGPIPSADSAIRQSSICHTKKSENTDLSSFFGRPRVTLTLPAGFALEASYLPPIQIGDATPNLGSAALSWMRRIRMAPTGNATAIMLRIHGTAGHVRGPITCPRSALQQSDPNGSCYGTQQSTDEFKPTMMGVEGVLSTAAWDGRLAFYAGGGENFLRPRFQVGFIDSSGNVDRTLIVVDLNRATMFAGVTAEVSNAIDLSAQAYGVNQDGVTFRFGGGYRLYR